MDWTEGFPCCVKISPSPATGPVLIYPPPSLSQSLASNIFFYFLSDIQTVVEPTNDLLFIGILSINILSIEEVEKMTIIGYFNLYILTKGFYSFIGL